jgi:hypothetical protein
MSSRSVGEQRRERQITAGLFLLLLLCYTYTLPRWADPNQNSRLDMVIAVVEEGTFRIDSYVENTVDYAKVGEHYYSDKPPGAAFLGIPVYAGLRVLFNLPIMDGLMSRLAANEALGATLREEGTGLLEHKVRFAIAQVALTFVASALPTALMGVLMYRLLARLTPAVWPRLGVVLGYGLLTPVFAYAGAFYGHQLSAACLLAAFYLTFAEKRPLSTHTLLAIGFLLGYSVITEYPTVLMAGILFLYTFFRLTDRRCVGWMILSGGLVAAGWMAYNTAVFGGPLSLGYSYSELWQEQHHTGFMSLTVPHAEALWGITFSGFRGLFLLSPLLLFALPGFALWHRSGEHRLEFWAALASVLAMFLFNASSIMWWGGYAVGPRYLLPMLPFMALPIIFAFRAWGRRTWLRITTLILGAWSLITTWGLTLAGQAFPPDTIRSPLVEYAWPNWVAGNVARNLGMFLHLPGVVSLAPLLVSLAAFVAALWFLARREPGLTAGIEESDEFFAVGEV